MQYTYEDEFLTKNFDEDKITLFENNAITSIDKLNVTDDYYYERLVKLKVYLFLCAVMFEDETVQKKYKLYEDEYNALEKKIHIKPSVRSVQLSRG